jgi:hypothetical protein
MHPVESDRAGEGCAIPPSTSARAAGRGVPYRMAPKNRR